MKLIILVAVLFFSVDAIGAADTTLTHQATPEPPVRLLDSRGYPICPQDIPVIHEMDCDTKSGWRWDTIEWGLMKRGLLFVPAFDTDAVHGPNGGESIT